MDEATRNLTRKEAARIIAGTFPEYRGRKIRLQYAKTVTFSGTYWDEGSRSTYAAMDHTGRTDKLDLSRVAPWRNPIEGKTVDLPPGVIIVEHCISCGRDAGLYIYMNPESKGILES